MGGKRAEEGSCAPVGRASGAGARQGSLLLEGGEWGCGGRRRRGLLTVSPPPLLARKVHDQLSDFPTASGTSSWLLLSGESALFL